MSSQPTNLDWNSNHPFHCKVAIVYSQALRIHMICSDASDRQYFLNKLRTRFIESNYPAEIIQQQFMRAMSVNRADLIWKVKPSKQSKFTAPFVYTHNKYGPPWKKWFMKHKHILELEPKFKKIVENIKFVTKQPKNLQKLLTSAKVRHEEKRE